MKLTITIPSRVVLAEDVTQIVAEGEHGSFCLLPRHIDFLAALVPGLLAYVGADGQERFAAVDEGVLVKRGEEVLVSTQQAVAGVDLDQLRKTVELEFSVISDRERAANAAAAKLEASFLRTYLELQDVRE